MFFLADFTGCHGNHCWDKFQLQGSTSIRLHLGIWFLAGLGTHFLFQSLANSMVLPYICTWKQRFVYWNVKESTWIDRNCGDLTTTQGPTIVYRQVGEDPGDIGSTFQVCFGVCVCVCDFFLKVTFFLVLPANSPVVLPTKKQIPWKWMVER